MILYFEEFLPGKAQSYFYRIDYITLSNPKVGVGSWLSLYLLPSTSPLMKMPLRACC